MLDCRLLGRKYRSMLQSYEWIKLNETCFLTSQVPINSFYTYLNIRAISYQGMLF